MTCHICREDITELGKNVAVLQNGISNIQSTVSEINGMMKVIPDLSGRVERQGRRISWLYGLVTVLIALMGYQLSPWK